uniref:Uncharacterized protein n=1 Tax=Parascaris univalens TaxID=6257 RepID=A0A915ARX0_PARUN
MDAYRNCSCCLTHFIYLQYTEVSSPIRTMRLGLYPPTRIIRSPLILTPIEVPSRNFYLALCFHPLTATIYNDFLYLSASLSAALLRAK